MAGAREPDPRDRPQLKHIELLLLTMLSAGERHGYGLRRDILTFTDGRVSLEAGNLYRHIRNLEAAGMIGELPASEVEPGHDERRIYYKLLPFGRRMLAAEALRLREIVRMAEANRVISPRRA
jgi:PadR family transcriptional regulator